MLSWFMFTYSLSFRQPTVLVKLNQVLIHCLLQLTSNLHLGSNQEDQITWLEIKRLIIFTFLTTPGEFNTASSPKRAQTVQDQAARFFQATGQEASFDHAYFVLCPFKYPPHSLCSGFSSGFRWEPTQRN